MISGENDRKFVFEGDARPADCLTWEEMRGKDAEFNYPKTKAVAPESIIGKLRAKTGIVQIDLPTSYQFGCAWNAGTDGSGRDARLTGRHFSNQRDGRGGFSSKHTVVGSYSPNEWGVYDLHGNVWEMCVDHSGGRNAEVVVDPEGPVTGAKRQTRGGGWHSSDRFICCDSVPQNKEPGDRNGWAGCRIVINTSPGLEVCAHEAMSVVGTAKTEVVTQKTLSKDRTTVQSILDGMIEVPGDSFWLSETELTQGQWEAVMGSNPAIHKGANLPVENVSRDDCEAFLKELNQTREVLTSQFEFRLPDLNEWKYAAWAGSAGHGSWIRPGIVGNILDMAWVRENSSNQTHAVATKAPNAFGLYDMLGNVWEWLDGEVQLPKWKGRGALKGCHYNQLADVCTWNQNAYFPKSQRNADCGLRVAAHLRSRGAKRLEPQHEAETVEQCRQFRAIQDGPKRVRDGKEAAAEGK